MKRLLTIIAVVFSAAAVLVSVAAAKPAKTNHVNVAITPVAVSHDYCVNGSDVNYSYHVPPQNLGEFFTAFADGFAQYAVGHGGLIYDPHSHHLVPISAGKCVRPVPVDVDNGFLANSTRTQVTVVTCASWQKGLQQDGTVKLDDGTYNAPVGVKQADGSYKLFPAIPAGLKLTGKAVGGDFASTTPTVMDWASAAQSACWYPTAS